MTILEWNINGRSNTKGNCRFPASVAQTLLSENPDVFVLLEYVPGGFSEEDYEGLAAAYDLHETTFIRKKKNAVLLGVKREIPHSFLPLPWEEGSLMPDAAFAVIRANGKHIGIVGFRMLTGLRDGYDGERDLFDAFLPYLRSFAESCDGVLLAGDFNNALHYGPLTASFSETEALYADKLQIHYNLHLIQDLLREEGFVLIENEEDFSFIKHYENQDIFIHDDHLFVRGVPEVSARFGDFNGSDHRFFIGTAKTDF